MSVNLPSEDPLIRMQRDLKRAKTKNLKDIKWGMVIDIAKCIGCHACTVDCVAENKLPPGVIYRVVLEEETGTYPTVGRRFVPRPCVQCQNPPCVKFCPVTATYKNEQQARTQVLDTPPVPPIRPMTLFHGKLLGVSIWYCCLSGQCLR